jgi:mono/diheme cytochrome c family protein
VRAADDAGEKLFATRVLPLFKERCLACHGDDLKKIKGEFDMRTREGLLKGGESKLPSLVPGKPDQSRMIQAVLRLDKDLSMPPKENDRLSPEQIAWIKDWIAGGAPWPEPARLAALSTPAHGDHWDAADGVTMETSGGRTPDWTNRRYKYEDLWAWQPIQRPTPPQVTVHDPKKVSILSVIDAFIEQRLEEKDLIPAPRADRRTLIRRATYDLSGLPPTVDEVEAFVHDDAPGAFEKLVARLLKSPRYGEQQARHWLDVARYADTSGLSNDYERPNAWRYRDYVIRSFNADKPYDRFVTEQLAGDELDPKNPELLIATGFLRLGPWEHTGMTVAALTRQDFLDDVTHHVGVTLLGQGLRCARCHDHKFDPVPTQDYYRLQAVFATTQFAERSAPFLPEENTGQSGPGKARAQQRLDDTKALMEDVRQKSDDAIAVELKNRGVKHLADLPEGERPGRRFFGLTSQERSLDKMYAKRADYFERELQRYSPLAFSVYDGPQHNYTSVKAVNPVPERRDGMIQIVHILPGGSIETPTDAVTPGVLSAVHGVRAEIPESIEGRRLALAHWVTSKDNSLTARVIVNRIWQQHFGRGLVATPNNFGKMGAKPTNPELLDWLATWFMDNGWSVKKLHSLIMNSAVYQRSGAPENPDRLAKVDANDDLLAYYPSRRLAAEEIRDTALAVTGELNLEMGGPGVFPEINWEVALQPRHIMGSVAPPYQPSATPAERNRRTIYTFRYRTLSDPMLEVFNRPGSEISCERRDTTTVTPQAFSLFNGEFAQDRALALAAALGKSNGTDAEKIGQAFKLLYGRAPGPGESETCLAHLSKMIAFHRAHPPAKSDLPVLVHREMIEEMTGEAVHWDDKLDLGANYHRDLKPWDVKAETRALADVCLVLLNSNEFLYLR